MAKCNLPISVPVCMKIISTEVDIVINNEIIN